MESYMHRGRPKKQEGDTLSSFLHAPESSLRERYAVTLDKNESLKELARLRRTCEIAAEEINKRIVPDEQKCLMCKKELPLGHKVAMMANLKDDATGIVTTHPICSLNCVREYNKVKMGMSELVK